MDKDEEEKTEKLPTTADLHVDGFEGYENEVEGHEQQTSGRVIVGEKIAFTNEATWVNSSGEELPRALELIAGNVLRVTTYWKDGRPIEEKTKILPPGQKFPDVEKLNAEVPQSEWGEGPDGRPRGPWQNQHVVRLLDLGTMSKYSWPSPVTTIGSAICVSEVVDQVQWMRRYRGQRVYPVLTLSDTFMPTRYGGRQRPHFEIKRWITFGDGGTMLPAAGQPPTAKEVTGDEIRF